FWFLALFVLALPAGASANQQSIAAILSFTVDVENVTVSELEAGTVDATFSWQTVGMQEGDRLLLYVYEINTWVLLTNPEEVALEPSGSIEIPLRHPLNFNPLSYRLLIVDENEVTRSERSLIIPYLEDDLAEPPRLVAFTST